MSSGRLYEWFTQKAAERSQERAFTFVQTGGGATVTYTYERLFERVDQLATKLGARHDDSTVPLGLLLHSQESQVLHYLAALAVGVVPAILTPPNRKLNRDYYAQTMSELLRRCRFGALVTDVEGLDFGGLKLEPYKLEVQAGIPSSDRGEYGSDSVTDALFMQFSSGTTGIKKGVLVDDEAMTAQLRAYSTALKLDDQDCIVSWLPLYHDMGFIACLNMPLAYGVHTVMIDPVDWVTDPALYLQAVSDYRGTLSWHPNFAYAFMAKRVRDRALTSVDLSSLRGLVNCSEPVTLHSQRAFLDRFQTRGISADVFRGCYAMAETTFALTHGDPDDPMYLDPLGPSEGVRTPGQSDYVSVGRPLPGVEMKVMDLTTQIELSDRELGEIWVRSPFNFSRYFNDETATSQALVGDWYRTGDLGYRVDSAFFVIGRAKDLLIVAGVNVFPQEIEETVSQVDGVHPGRVSAFAVFDESLQTERVVVLAESDRDDDVERRRIVQEVRQRVLAAFQIGNFDVSLVPRQWLVKSTSGKVARNANKSKWLEMAGTK